MEVITYKSQKSVLSFSRLTVPKRIVLMNTGEELSFKVEPLPEFFDLETGKGDGEYLHIKNIPINDLETEPIVIEIERNEE